MLFSLILAATLSDGALAEAQVLHDFGRDDAARFRCVNDTVMGGRSTSRVEALDGGTLRFSGTVSLENNGGFTSFAVRDADYEIPVCDGLVVRVKGDGRTYILSLDLVGVPIPAGGYWQSFATHEDEWLDVKLPFSAFVPTSFGRALNGLPAVTPDRIRGLTVYLYDKQAGPFSAEFDSIATYRDDVPANTEPSGVADDAAVPVPGDRESVPPVPPATTFILAAIERGVPLFNAGNVTGCAAVYRTAVEAIVVLAPQSVDASQLDVLRAALAKAAGQSDRDAAWTLRAAMDAVASR